MAVALTVGALGSGFLQAAPHAFAAVAKAPKAVQVKPIPVSPVTSHYKAPKSLPSTHAAVPVWPSGSATADLSQTVHSLKSPAGTKVGNLPIWVGSAQSAAIRGKKSGAARSDRIPPHRPRCRSGSWPAQRPKPRASTACW